MVTAIEYGSLTGQYFTQWRIDLLQELLGYVVEGFGGGAGIPVENTTIWYDANEDFHMLSFDSGGHHVEVRFYKVFSSKIDGKDGWVGCPRSNIIGFAQHLRERASQRPES